MIRFNPTTRIQLYRRTNDYIPGKGSNAEWELLGSSISDAMETNTFFCEWRGTYGDRLLSAQAQGVRESATIRMVFNPKLLDAMQRAPVVIVKHADGTAIKNGQPDSANPNVYEVWSGADNVAQENLFMEFMVRRYENK